MGPSFKPFCIVGETKAVYGINILIFKIKLPKKYDHPKKSKSFLNAFFYLGRVLKLVDVDKIKAMTLKPQFDRNNNKKKHG